MLGGAATYFAVAASFFTHVNLVGIVGDDFTDKDASIFRGRRVDTAGLERAAGKTFFWAGRYNENMNERTTLGTELNVFAEFKPRLQRPCGSPRGSPRPNGRRRHLRWRIHGLSGKRWPRKRRRIASRHGVWLSDGKFRRGEIRAGPPSYAQAPGNQHPRTALLQ